MERCHSPGKRHQNAADTEDQNFLLLKQESALIQRCPVSHGPPRTARRTRGAVTSFIARGVCRETVYPAVPTNQPTTMKKTHAHKRTAASRLLAVLVTTALGLPLWVHAQEPPPATTNDQTRSDNQARTDVQGQGQQTGSTQEIGAMVSTGTILQPVSYTHLTLP